MKNYIKPISMTFMATVLCVSSAQADLFNGVRNLGDKLNPINILAPKKNQPAANSGYFPPAPVGNGAAYQPAPTQKKKDAPKPVYQGPIKDQAPALSQSVLQALNTASLQIDGVSINTEKLKAIYGVRKNAAVWVNYQGFTEMGWKVQEIMPSMASWNGLNPNNYMTENLIGRIDQIAQGQVSAQALVETEILISQAYLNFVNDMVTGRINPKDPNQNLGDLELRKNSSPSATDIAASMYSEQNMYQGIDYMAPPFDGYKLLQHSLANLEESYKISAWVEMSPLSKSLRPGDINANIVGIRQRLVSLGYLGIEEIDNRDTQYDSKLASAVMKFQEAHNLGPDGVIGNGTFGILNRSYSSIREQVIANMERWRFYPRQNGKFIMVDFGRQELDIMENGDSILTRRVVVGGEMTGTPTMADKIVGIKLAPDWTSPISIMINETIPKLNPADPAEKFRNKIDVISTRDGHTLTDAEINAVDWKSYTLQNPPPYKFVEKNGEGSSLGLVKFELTNGHSIYLHDTGNRDVFNKQERFLSHGCVRVDDPFSLVAYLKPSYKDANGYAPTPDQEANPEFWKALARAQTLPEIRKPMSLKVNPVDVYIFGNTINNLRNSAIILGKDIYKQDARIITALSLIGKL